MTAAVDDRAAPWMPFEDWAARIGHYAWFEEQLFALLGAWSAHALEPEACVLLASHASHRAWHAELWHQLLPTVAGRDATELVRAPGGELTGLIADLEPDPTSPSATGHLLGGVYGVVGPLLASTYTTHRATAASVAEAPTLRILGWVSTDQAVDLDQGRRLLERVAGDPTLPVAASWRDRLADRWRAAWPEGW